MDVPMHQLEVRVDICRPRNGRHGGEKPTILPPSVKCIKDREVTPSLNPWHSGRLDPSTTGSDRAVIVLYQTLEAKQGPFNRDSQGHFMRVTEEVNAGLNSLGAPPGGEGLAPRIHCSRVHQLML